MHKYVYGFMYQADIFNYGYEVVRWFTQSMFFIFIIGCSCSLWDDWYRSQANIVLLLQRQFSSYVWIAIVSELKLACSCFVTFVVISLYYVGCVFPAIVAPYFDCFYRFLEGGRLFTRWEVWSIEIGLSGLFFIGDETSLLMVWKWLEEPKVPSSWATTKACRRRETHSKLGRTIWNYWRLRKRNLQDCLVLIHVENIVVQWWFLKLYMVGVLFFLH